MQRTTALIMWKSLCTFAFFNLKLLSFVCNMPTDNLQPINDYYQFEPSKSLLHFGPEDLKSSYELYKFHICCYDYYD